jgi:hypothetical protein
MLSDEVPLSLETLCYNGTELDVPKITVLSAIRYTTIVKVAFISATSFMEIFKQDENPPVRSE